MKEVHHFGLNFFFLNLPLHLNYFIKAKVPHHIASTFIYPFFLLTQMPVPHHIGCGTKLKV